MENVKICGKNISVFSGLRENAVYLHSAADEAEVVWMLLSEPKPTLVSVGGVDWNAELSPWRAEGVFRGGGDFSGGAEAYLTELCGKIIPETETRFGIDPKFRTIAGYSLGGLFAVYAAYRSALFSAVASMSGSLWFDGFCDFAHGNDFLRRPERAYFSLGDREKNAKNPRMARVETCTGEIAGIFAGRGVETTFEMNAGGHFRDVPQRIARGIDRVTGARR